MTRTGIELTRPRSTALRSEEHTSELQSRSDLVCRLLLEKKKKEKKQNIDNIKTKQQKSQIAMRKQVAVKIMHLILSGGLTRYLLVLIQAKQETTRDSHA